jgi:SAM-dependent MidA family methyltransferase
MIAETHQPHAPAATPLAAKLLARIAETGPVTLHDYMAACLYDPEHGYYRRAHPLGASGDFITAPEISQVFGEMLGLWAADTWARMGAPSRVQLIELGPGRGTLMADALRVLRAAPDFRAACSVALVEVSHALREEQQRLLAAAPVPVAWSERLSQAPAGPAILIANEYLDCLPIRQFIHRGGAGWLERHVAAGPAGLSLIEGPIAEPFHGLPQAKEGDIYEMRPGTGPLVAELARRAEAEPLAAVFIDYGYAGPAFGETLQAVRRHRFAGLFEAPGETDLTAHVDFGAFIREAHAAGLDTHGPIPMGEFLLRLGMGARVQQLLAHAKPAQADRIRMGAARLIDPAQMGALFKVVVIRSAGVRALSPFGD